MSPSGGVSIQWFGQATFLLTSSAGTRTLIDPAHPAVGYAMPKLADVDAVLVGHEHGDHNYVAMVEGQTVVVRGLQEGNWASVDQRVKGVRIRALGTYHDDQQGKLRGKNTVFVLEVDGLRVVHASDLGHPLSPEQVREIGPVDVLMLPVGGHYTIDAAGATKVVEQLGPKVVVPMHFKTARSRPDWPGTGVEPFLAGKRVERPDSNTLMVSQDTLPAETTVYVLKYE